MKTLRTLVSMTAAIALAVSFPTAGRSIGEGVDVDVEFIFAKCAGFAPNAAVVIDHYDDTNALKYSYTGTADGFGHFDVTIEASQSGDYIKVYMTPTGESQSDFHHYSYDDSGLEGSEGGDYVASFPPSPGGGCWDDIHNGHIRVKYGSGNEGQTP